MNPSMPIDPPHVGMIYEQMVKKQGDRTHQQPGMFLWVPFLFFYLPLQSWSNGKGGLLENPSVQASVPRSFAVP